MERGRSQHAVALEEKTAGHHHEPEQAEKGELACVSTGADPACHVASTIATCAQCGCATS
jgi:hypothetical protein